MIRGLIYTLFSIILFFQVHITSAIGIESYSKIYSGKNQQKSVADIELVRNIITGAGRQVYELNVRKDIDGLKRFADSLLKLDVRAGSDSLLRSDIYYFAGVCNLFASRHHMALQYLKRSIHLRSLLEVRDDRYAKSVFNAGLTTHMLGDFIQVIEFMQEYISFASDLYGPDSQEMAEAYTELAGASIECRDHEKFIEYSFKALGILGRNPDALTGNRLSVLNSVIGAGYARSGDFSKARLYLEKAEKISIDERLTQSDNYINLLNSLAFVYGSLGLSDLEEEYYGKGIELALNNNSYMAYNLINSYALKVGKSGNPGKGERFIAEILRRSGKIYGTESRFYTEVLENYATYLVEYLNEPGKALDSYIKLLEYIEKNPDDKVIREYILSGYAKAHFRNGNSKNALRLISHLLWKSSENISENHLYENPPVDSLTPNKNVLKLLQLKYEILWKENRDGVDMKMLESAAATAELIISLLDRIRIDITEEESRLVLGDNYRNSYLLAIRDFELCYRKSGNQKFLEKAFEFAERSKVAGLLAATRQMKATQFHIPEKLAEKEKSLQREIGFYNARINLERARTNPDNILIADWNEKLLKAVAARDSLVLNFEKEYPGYYGLKYNTDVPLMKDIPSIIGRRTNYVNYVLSDSILYIFFVNKKHQELVTVRTDSSFLNSLSDFRFLLSDPSQSESARKKFNDYQQTGFDLYTILVEPVKKYFISRNLLISPDNILAYIPFEAFILSKYSGNDILYRKLDYLMNYFNISYAYSATFINESASESGSSARSLIAFAPSYRKHVNIDTLIAERLSDRDLADLAYARQEAEYVSDMTGGKLLMNNEAQESIYKAEASAYRIVHLAMHTLVNDTYPMNSALIFSGEDDKKDDGFLHTYEVYGIPLRATMVVLSSCNTGSGKLSTGEGILSLARGFLYSGSRSVVMSLWKVEDHSGTEIVKMFYGNLKNGMPKSKALKKARYDYLRNASQLRSHPYFWSTLVIFGENSPVFFPWKKVIICSAVLMLITALIIYLQLRNRRYS